MNTGNICNRWFRLQAGAKKVHHKLCYQQTAAPTSLNYLWVLLSIHLYMCVLLWLLLFILFIFIYLTFAAVLSHYPQQDWERFIPGEVAAGVNSNTGSALPYMDTVYTASAAAEQHRALRDKHHTAHTAFSSGPIDATTRDTVVLWASKAAVKIWLHC